MNKDEIILMLQQLVTSLLQQLDEALRQLGEANSKADALLLKIEELENLLVLKNAEEQKQRNVIKGLTKIQQNKSEKQAPSAASGTEAAPQAEPKPREKTNYGARRKQHYEVEVKEDNYLAGDETYHRVLVRVPGGKNSRKGYIWVVTAMHTGLVYYFYHDGSRAQDVILNYIGDYGGTFQSDGFSPYRKMAKMLTRLACLQHVKRKFLNCEGDEEAQGIAGLINELYLNDHKHIIGKDGWTGEEVNDFKLVENLKKDINPGRNRAGLQELQDKLAAKAEKQVQGNGLTDEQLKIYSTIGGTPHLDGQYTVFGEVEECLDVVEMIQGTVTAHGDRPVDDIEIRISVIIE